MSDFRELRGTLDCGALQALWDLSDNVAAVVEVQEQRRARRVDGGRREELKVNATHGESMSSAEITCVDAHPWCRSRGVTAKESLWFVDSNIEVRGWKVPAF